MKKILSCISLFVLCFMAQVAFAQKVWYNPAEVQGNVVRGRTFVDQERDGFYHRFPSSVKSKVNKNLPGYKAVHKITIRHREFDKTTTQKIKRMSEDNLMDD